MQTNFTYPAIFTHDATNRCYYVEFIDFKCCIGVSGESIANVIEAAEEAMGRHLSFVEQFPEATQNINLINVNENQFVSFVRADMLKYWGKYRGKAIKKTLTIPGWLNDLAEAEGVNFSKLLQDALKKELEIDE